MRLSNSAMIRNCGQRACAVAVNSGACILPRAEAAQTSPVDALLRGPSNQVMLMLERSFGRRVQTYHRSHHCWPDIVSLHGRPL